MTGTFQFERSWGSEVREDGSARFRLWAPGLPSVSLHVPASGRSEPMRPEGDGWFGLETRAVAPGEAYALALPDGTVVPDPAARAQAGDVHGPSLLVDPNAYRWRTPGWRGRPWAEAVVYEVHTGAFSPDGTFDGIAARLDYLADTGFTAIELMPVAQFSGTRGWGYDGVLLYAPHPAYGGPEGLKRLIDGAHARGLMVLLDVVYNHFGPDGNYLARYAPEFFDPSRHTPWGAAIAYRQPAVRRFFIENALYWLEEYRLDGLRLDAIDQIRDPGTPHLLEELALEVRQRITDRRVHLTTEDERNITRLHAHDDTNRPRLFTAEWNDDVHHVAHVLATGETDGYYRDYADAPAEKLARALAEGFVYQGEASVYHDGAPRGEPSAHQPPLAFVDFLQNHDQIGNRALGERLTTLAGPAAIELLTAVLLLSPHVPLVYMGEEWGETRPFLFFTDFHDALADAVREGRRNEFRRWPQFQDPQRRARIPDPNAETTFAASRLDWDAAARSPHGERLALFKRLLDVRHRELVPLLAATTGNAGRVFGAEGTVVHVTWELHGQPYGLVVNVGDREAAVPRPIVDRVLTGMRTIYAQPDGASDRLQAGSLGPWSGVFVLGADRNQRRD